MTRKFICDVNTSHSPQMAFYKEWTKQFIEENVDKIIDAIDPDIEWEIVGDSTIYGIDAVRKHFFTTEKMEGSEIELLEMHIENILSHGKSVCGWGTLKMTSNSTARFCDILEFTTHKHDAKVKKVITFVVEIPKE